MNRIDMFAEYADQLVKDLLSNPRPKCEVIGCPNSATQVWRGKLVCGDHDWILSGAADYEDQAKGRGWDA